MNIFFKREKDKVEGLLTMIERQDGVEVNWGFFFFLRSKIEWR